MKADRKFRGKLVLKTGREIVGEFVQHEDGSVSHGRRSYDRNQIKVLWV